MADVDDDDVLLLKIATHCVLRLRQIRRKSVDFGYSQLRLIVSNREIKVI